MVSVFSPRRKVSWPKGRRFRFRRQIPSLSGIINSFRYDLLVLILLYLGLILFKSNWLAVREVRVFLEGDVWNGEAVSSFVKQRLLGTNLVFTDTERWTALVKKKFLTVAGMSVSRRWPPRFDVHLYPRLPLAFVLPLPDDQEVSLSAFVRDFSQLASSSAERVFIDDSGLAFFEGRADRPALVLPRSHLEVGRRLDQSGEKNLIGVLVAARKQEISVSFIATFQGDVLLVLPGGAYAWLNVNKDPNQQMELLKMIVEKYKIEAKSLVKIDLRFKNPVVEFR